MEQLLAHLVGDFILQSPWMALNKNKRTFNCLVHVLLYTCCFLFLTRSWRALLVIGGTHFLIDRFGLARYLVWAKNHLSPTRWYPPWRYCRLTGYYDEWQSIPVDETEMQVEALARVGSLARQPLFMSVWLTIVADNTLHLLANYLSIRFL